MLALYENILRGRDFFRFLQSRHPHLRSSKSAPKQAMCKHMADAGGFEDEDAGFAKKEKNHHRAV